MRNAAGGDVQCVGDNSIIIPITIKSCSTGHLSPSDLFSFTIDVNKIVIVTKDVDLLFRPQASPPLKPNETKRRFIRGLLVNAYADLMLTVKWGEDRNESTVHECHITVPHEWYKAYSSPDHARW